MGSQLGKANRASAKYRIQGSDPTFDSLETVDQAKPTSTTNQGNIACHPTSANNRKAPAVTAALGLWRRSLFRSGRPKRSYRHHWPGTTFATRPCYKVFKNMRFAGGSSRRFAETRAEPHRKKIRKLLVTQTRQKGVC